MAIRFYLFVEAVTVAHAFDDDLLPVKEGGIEPHFVASLAGKQGLATSRC